MPVPPPMTIPNTILVVDDNESVLYARGRVLRRAGYRVLEASNGRAALEAIAANQPELVILDVHLPDMSGFEVCRSIKSDPDLSVIPVLHMSSTNVSAPEQVRGLEGGADGYLVEPIENEVLIATVAAMLRMHRAEREARQSRRALDALVSNLPGAAYRCDELGGQLSFVSGGAAELTGLPPASLLALARGWWDQIMPEDREVVSRLTGSRANQAPVEMSYRLRHADGSVRWIWDRAVPVRRELGGFYWEGFATDVTERKRAQDVIAREHERLEFVIREKTTELETSHEQLRLSERLAGLGTLSAGLGHDMGNLLLPMRIHLETLAQMPLAQEAKAEVAALSECCEYLNRLAVGLKMLAVDSTGSGGESLELSDWWKDAGPLLRSILPPHIELIVALPPAPCSIGIRKAALTQVVFNLVQNAADAMSHLDRGEIKIAAECDLDSQAVITVTDSGPGMSPEVARRCLEPFFTTKARGRSTGLGLALVRSIVQDARGELKIESEIGRGTTFSIRLPMKCDAAPVPTRGRLLLQVHSPRVRALVAHEARLLGCEVVPEWPGQDVAAHVVDRLDAVRAPGRTVLVGPAGTVPPGVVALPIGARSKEIRDALRRVLGAE